MSCWLHRWRISHAADARRAAPHATQRHLAACAACRAYADLCTRLPQALAAAAPAVAGDSAVHLLQQRIFTNTTLVPSIPSLKGKTAPVFPAFERVAEFFSNPLKPALATFAFAVVALTCLLLPVGLARQQLKHEQRLITLAALQDMRLAYDHALQQGPSAVVGLLDAATQRFADDAATAAAAVDFFGAALPPAAQPDRS